MRRAILIAALSLATATAASGAAAAQTASPRCSVAPVDCSGWYAVDVRLSWLFTADFTQNCDSFRFTQDGLHPRTCLVSNDNLNWTPFPVTVRVDKAAPVVTGAAASRGADTNGWYRTPVEIRFFGDDATSGVVGCSSGTYSGPDAAAAQVLGRCWDRAGNVSAPGTFDLRYDATAPSLARVTASGRDHKVRLEWAVPDAVDLDVRRDGRRLLSGGPSGNVVDRRLRNGHRYQYLVTATDAAGNTAKRTLGVVPGPRLLGPRAGVALDHPPLLRWTRIRGADYYNVQVFRGKRKVLSAWPTRPKLRLPEKWRYGGHKRGLKAGRRYRWFVWPGEGARDRNEYGRLIGARTFVITP
jgi:hypothetical protein